MTEAAVTGATAATAQQMEGNYIQQGKLHTAG